MLNNIEILWGLHGKMRKKVKFILKHFPTKKAFHIVTVGVIQHIGHMHIISMNSMSDFFFRANQYSSDITTFDF